MKWLLIMTTFAVVGGLTPFGQPAHAENPSGVDLAQLDGWDIVVPNDGIATEVYAAEEFQRFFAEAGGIRLPIVHRIDRPKRHVLIGPGEVMRGSDVGFAVDDMGPEDLRIVVREGNIAIAGGRPRGTLYGVYTFLEDYLGVRFLTPDHTHVPPVGDTRLVPSVDRVYRPPFANYRGVGYAARGNGVFAVRHRANNLYNDPKFGIRTPFCSPFINIGHSFYRQIPLEQYAEDHPEYFAMWDGKRDNKHVHTHYCLSNPELISIVTKAVVEEIEHPSSAGRANFAVSQNDTIWEYCQCDKCMAIDEAEDSHMGTLLRFVNTIADKVAKAHPSIYIGTLSYGFSRKPPQVTTCRPNVQINLSNIEACQLHAITDSSCPSNVEFMKDLDGWTGICDHLNAWIYCIDFRDHLLPYPNLHTIQPNIQTLVRAGVEGVFAQCSDWPVAEMSDLRHYVISRLVWNPEYDDDVLIQEFITLHYGQAAPAIHRFLDLIHDHYAAAGTHNASCIYGRWDLPVDPFVAQEGLDIFNEALALAQDEETRKRVEKASLCAYRAAIDPVWRLEEDVEIDPALAESMRPLVKEFFRLCDEYGLGGRVEGDRQRLERILGATSGEEG